MSNADLLAAIVVIRRKACESDSLLPRGPANLRKTHQDGHGGRQSDAVIDQPEPLGKAGMLADRRDQSLEFGLLALLQAGDILVPELLNLRTTAALSQGVAAASALGSAFSRFSRRAISPFQSFLICALRQLSIRFLRRAMSSLI